MKSTTCPRKYNNAKEMCVHFHGEIKQRLTQKDIVSSRVPVKTISSSSYAWHPQIVTDVMPNRLPAKFPSPLCLRLAPLAPLLFL